MTSPNVPPEETEPSPSDTNIKRRDALRALVAGAAGIVLSPRSLEAADKNHPVIAILSADPFGKSTGKSVRGTYKGPWAIDAQPPLSGLKPVIVTVKGKEYFGWAYPSDVPGGIPPKKVELPEEGILVPHRELEQPKHRTTVTTLREEEIVRLSKEIQCKPRMPRRCKCPDGKVRPITKYYEYKKNNHIVYWYRCPQTGAIKVLSTQ